jgi:hypothetical protein
MTTPEPFPPLELDPVDTTRPVCFACGGPWEWSYDFAHVPECSARADDDFTYRDDIARLDALTHARLPGKFERDSTDTELALRNVSFRRVTHDVAEYHHPNKPIGATGAPQTTVSYLDGERHRIVADFDPATQQFDNQE